MSQRLLILKRNVNEAGLYFILMYASIGMSVPNYAVDFKDCQLLTNGRFPPYDIEIKSMW